MNTTGCRTCDSQDVPLGDTALIDLHRALHELARAILEPWARLLERITR